MAIAIVIAVVFLVGLVIGGYVTLRLNDESSQDAWERGFDQGRQAARKQATP